MKESRRRIMKGFTAGIVATLMILILMGAIRNERFSDPITVINDPESRQVALAQNGRYQISACALDTGREGNGGYGVFVMDTATGVTKAAYVSFYDGNGKTVSVNQLGKPFSRIKTHGGSGNR